MIINSSLIAQSSEHKFSQMTQVKKVSITQKAAEAVSLDLTDDAKSYVDQIEDAQKKEQKEEQEQQVQNWKNNLHLNTSTGMGSYYLDDTQNLKLRLLQSILKSMGMGDGEDSLWEAIFGRYQKSGNENNQNTGTGSTNQTKPGTVQNIWTKTTATLGFQAGGEFTTYTAAGAVKTADGREISFNVGVSMSRAFYQEFQSVSQQSFVMTDPLVINLDSYQGNLTDQKFLFDLDSDGEKEEMSFAGKGSGFLALDRNQDGEINDGSELFGTKSGDGFRDLARYDEDSNGWIDEGDSVFSKLKIWTKDEDGNDQLINLKEANVGAIYLNAADTKFTLNSQEQNINGAIQKTGIYLKESGEVGTIQHIDLAL